MGVDWLTSRPARRTMRRMTWTSCSSSSKVRSSMVMEPFCSTKICLGPFTIISVMLSSFKMASSGPKPRKRAYTSPTTVTRWSMGIYCPAISRSNRRSMDWRSSSSSRLPSLSSCWVSSPSRWVSFCCISCVIASRPPYRSSRGRNTGRLASSATIPRVSEPLKLSMVPRTGTLRGSCACRAWLPNRV